MNKEIKLTTVYIPVKVNDEPIPESTAVFTFCREPKSKSNFRLWNTENSKSLDYEKEKLFTEKLFTHWLKQQESVVLTKKEFNTFLEEYGSKLLSVAAEKASVIVKNGHYVGAVYKQSITEVLPTVMEKYKL